MPLLELRQIGRSYGIETVLDGVDLVLERGERLGLVGANGSGKTTLCRIILRELEPDEGAVTLASGTTFGYLAQDPALPLDDSIRDAAMAGFEHLQELEVAFGAASEALADEAAANDPAELERRLRHQSEVLGQLEAAGGFDYEQRMLATLGALGFAPEDLDRPVRQLSGGEKSRLALARLLMLGCDLLLLDEPTNHLDIAMTEWLESFLKGFSGGVIVVSHDRWFLDNVCHKIGELESGGLTLYHFGDEDAKLPPPDDPEFAADADDGASHYGAYTHFVRVKAERRAADWKAYGTQQKELKRQEDWIRWKLNLRRGSHVAAARSRQKMLDKLDKVERPPDELPVVSLNFQPQHRGPNDIVDLRKLTFGYGLTPLFEGLDLFVRRLERVGIVGPNGCGKSSLLKLLLGELEPTAGQAKLGSTCEVGYYHQEHRDLDLQSTPLEEIRAVAPALPVGQARGFLARFLFYGDDVFRPVHSFSGGERSRLVLAKLIIRRPNVLLLDEPTNHLDIPSREVLEEALRGFEGTILAVSHDRWFLDRICRRLLIFGYDGVAVFDGSYHAYTARQDANAAAVEAAAAQDKKDRRKAHNVWEREAKQRKEGRRRDRASLRSLEQEISRLEGELSALQERYADPTLYEDGQQVQQLQQQEARLRETIAERYERWEALVEAGVE